MFNQFVNATKFTSDAADGIFGDRVYALSMYQGDVSFLATMRILLADRVPEGEAVILGYSSTSMADFADSFTAADIIEYMGLHRKPSSNTIRVYSLGSYGKKENERGIMKLVHDGFVAKHPEFEELKDVSAFVSKQMNALFFINKETKSSIAIVVDVTPARWHFLQVFISRLMPWYFADIERPLTEAERAFVFTLAEGNYQKYMDCIEEYAKLYDFRSGEIKKAFSGFGKNVRKRQIDETTSRIDRLEREIANMTASINSYLNDRADAIVRLRGLNAMASDASELESELIDYFMANKTLNNIEVTDRGDIRFIVATYIEYFDADMYDVFSKKDSSLLYNGYDTPAVFEPIEKKKLFFDAVFGENPLLKIKVCAYYSMNVNGYVTSQDHYTYGDEYANYIPNPHLQNFNCLGDHKRYIEECLRNNDIIGAVEQCVSSARSINLGEDPTMNRFFKDIFKSSKRIIELPDGTSCTPKEALKWLESRKEK